MTNPTRSVQVTTCNMRKRSSKNAKESERSNWTEEELIQIFLGVVKRELMKHVNNVCKVMFSIAEEGGDGLDDPLAHLLSSHDEYNPIQKYSKEMMLKAMQSIEDSHKELCLNINRKRNSQAVDLEKLRGFFNKMWHSLGDEKRDDVRRGLEEIGRGMLCLRTWSEEERKKYMVRVVNIFFTDYE